MSILKSPAMAGARLVSTNLRAASGGWVRLCPRWYMTGMPASWTTSEPKLRALEGKQ